MDPSLYKTFKVSRGFTYRYYSSPPKDSQARTILFLHGFPNADTDWRHQVTFFKARGYGVVVPQMLGYGETSKPTDPAAYRQSLMSTDLAEILDAEGINQVVVIGHDWGSFVAARFANFRPERTIAVGFVTVGYLPPNPNFNLEASNKKTKEMLGFEVLGYWNFLTAPDAPKLCMDNFENFFNAVWADPVEHLDPAKADVSFRTVLESKVTIPPPRQLSEERLMSEHLLKNGLEAPMTYYRAYASGIAPEDDKLLEGKADIDKPVFFLDALKDVIACEKHFSVAMGHDESPIAKHCKNATVKRVEVDHWVLFRIPHELNTMLLEWLGTF
ncbi:hypothetical protein AAF712_014252 [Marasmius tenuissimus]|uniref:AB hydrolase-1 domain-containing protein n=1 Tax=Marasmius tenuissimus TaxID=585030 RepID=A0ABR2ZDN4_9AGAR